MISSEVNFENVKCSFAEKKFTGNPTFLAECQGWKTESIFSKHKFQPQKFLLASRLQFGQSCRRHVDNKPMIFCSMSEKEKRTNQTSSKKFFSSKSPFGQVESTFENPAMKKMTKDLYSLAQLSKRIENHFLQNKFYHQNNPLET